MGDPFEAPPPTDEPGGGGTTKVTGPAAGGSLGSWAAPSGAARPQRSTEEHGTATREDPGAPLDIPHTQGAPEGYTAERPATDEYGEPGTPAAGLSPTAAHASDPAPGGASAQAVNAAAHAAPEQEQDHADAGVGPMDRPMWAAMALGLLLGVAIALMLWLAAVPK